MSETGARPLVQQVKTFLTNATPGASVAHSYHVEALTVPGVGTDPAFQRFSLVELNELHHFVAALGSVYRFEQGDPTALQSLGLNLAGFLENRQMALRLAASLPPAVTRNPQVQAMMSLIQKDQQQLEQNLPLLKRVIALSGVPSPGPLLVRCPMPSTPQYGWAD